MDPASDPAGDSVAGQRIGKYELISRLARGGMAELFVARVSGLQGFQKVVALKRILPHLAGDADFVEMFLAEARLSATLEHPNIVPVFDFGKAGNDYFFAMPYIHGKDLLAILRASQKRRMRLPMAQAIAVAIGVAAGLHYTHERAGYDGEPLGIVHRDISPANVLVTFDGHIKVADFGIAKAAAQTSVTKIGVRKGKAAYMSPEQVRGEELDRRSDIFSVGIVLWELLTMRRLFRGDNDLAIMHRIVSSAAPPPSSAAQDIPPELDAIVGRCLNPSMEERYATAKELQRDLERFAAEQGLSVAAGTLADYLAALFGRQDPPWASSLALPLVDGGDGTLGAAGPATAMPPAEPADGFVRSGGTAHIHRTDEITRSEAVELALARARPGRGGLLGAGLGALVAGVWWVASTPPAAKAVAPEAVTIVAAADKSASDSGSDRDLRDLLNLVNQPDWGLALQYGRRHAVLDRVGGNTALAAAVDSRLNLALDLLQADQSPAPCETYDAALRSIEARPDAYYVAALRAAEPPSGTPGCAGDLSGRRATLLGRLGPGTTTADGPSADDAPSADPVPDKRRPTKKRRRRPAAEKPDPAPKKIKKRDSGLRPFGE